ncbi:hypothetical protein AB4Z48_19560 [Cupriavidus sp. 2TAF22]|uniref:hypothetical protein n=1 Tax=unclassified Cupriavidus TaxID=2640874 RepID=UPI003F904B21
MSHLHPHACCLRCCSVLAFLVATLAQAEERPAGGGAGLAWDPFESESPTQVASNEAVVVVVVMKPAASDEQSGASAAVPTELPAGATAAQPSLAASLGGWGRPAVALSSGPPSTAYNDAPGPLAAAAGIVYTEPAPRPARPAVSLHLDDVTSATGYVGNRVQSLALALDTVLPQAGGLTIQPRVQIAYQSGADRGGSGFLGVQPGDASAAEVMVRLYRTQPTRLTGANGIYPFVEADLWQDRKQVININGTRIDPDMLRGLLSLNVGAHGSTNGGVKLWLKLKAGRSPGGTLGARYRW